MAGADAPHALYRFWGTDECLLYVGITADPGRRWSQHSDGKPWWPVVATVTLEWFPSRDAVLAAEREAIKTERPKYNLAHATVTAAVDMPSWPGCCVCGAAAWCWSIDSATAYSYEAREQEFYRRQIDEHGSLRLRFSDMLSDDFPAQAAVQTFCEQHADQADYSFGALDWRELVSNVGHVLANHEKMAAGSRLGSFLETISNYGTRPRRGHPGLAGPVR